jgi:hypothetical protein
MLCAMNKGGFMKKVIKFLSTTIMVIMVAYLLSGCTSEQSPTSTIDNIETPSLTTPDRPAEINGLIRSIEGNEVIIANEIRTRELSDEEREAQKVERQSMTQEERQALKVEEAESLETENITLVIPVGVPIIKGSGETDGTNLSAELTEIKVSTYVSMWLSDDQVEAVKLKGTN